MDLNALEGESATIDAGAKTLIQFRFYLSRAVPIQELVKVDPPHPNMALEFGEQPNEVRVRSTEYPQGELVNSDITYCITFSPSLQDIYGRPLGRELKFNLKIKCPAFRCAISSYLDGIRVFDPMLSGYDFPAFIIRSYNYKELRVCMYRMDPVSDLKKFNTYVKKPSTKSDTIDYMECGTKVFDSVVKHPQFLLNTETDFPIDLRPALDQGVTQIGLVVVPTTQSHFPNPWKSRNVVKVWLQCSKMSIEAIEGNHLFFWVNDLTTGKSIPGVNIEIRDQHSYKKIKNGNLITNDKGTCDFPHPGTASLLVIAKKDQDTCFLKMQAHTQTGDRAVAPKVLWHVFDDRKLYRPKETVHIKGYIRVLHPAKGPVPETRKAPEETKLSFKVRDARNTEILDSEALLNKFAAFSFDIPLPETVNLGEAKIDFKLPTLGTFTHSFDIQEVFQRLFCLFVSLFFFFFFDSLFSFSCSSNDQSSSWMERSFPRNTTLIPSQW